MTFLSPVLAGIGPAGTRISRLLRAGVDVIGSDRFLVLPFVLLFLVKAGRAALLLTLLYLGFVTRDWDTAFPLMLIALAYVPFEVLLQTFCQAALSKMTYDTLRNGRISLPATGGALLRRLFTLFFIGLVSTLVRYVSDAKQNGFFGFLLALLLFAVREVWDLISNFGIAVIMVERASLGTLVDRLKALRQHVPETLVGVIGIDLAGSLVTSLFAGGVVFGLFGGGAAGYIFADQLPGAFLAKFDEVGVNTLPTLAILMISFTLSALVQAATICAKSVYFTLLYVMVVRPDELPADRRAPLEAVLDGMPFPA